MISKAKCEICMEPYNHIQHCPRVCYNCGNSVCEKCLSDIRYQQGAFKCPFCKSTSTAWPKNLPVLNLLEEEKGVLLCQAHRRKAVSVCSSPECEQPVAICELAECSKLHKEKGTNNIPLSLFCQSTDRQAENKFMLQALVYFYDQLESEVVRNLRQKKKQAIDKNLSHEVDKPVFSSSSQAIIDNILKCDAKEVKSKQLSEIRTELINLEEQEELNVKAVVKSLLNREKERLIDVLQDTLMGIPTENFTLLQTVQPTEPTRTLSPVQGRQKEVLPPEFELIRKTVKDKFTASLIFSSRVHNKDIFKSRIAGQPNLVMTVELADGNILGVYLKRPFIKTFFEDIRMVDKDAFVFWHNQSAIFRAAVNSVAQYDVSMDYFVSVGNTNNWDGFWLKTDFSVLSPGQQSKNKLLIQSGQYCNMRIEVTTMEIRRFEVYQLDLL